MKLNPSQQDIKAALKSNALSNLPYEIASKLLAVNHMLGVINRWAKDSYGVLFWSGGFSPESFNPRFRVIYDGSVHMSWRPPFVVPCVWVEFEPFGVKERSAKFGLASWMCAPLLDPGYEAEV